MPASLFPAFVKIEYQSANAPHVMSLPTLAWNDPLDGSDGTFDTHGASTVDADTMINDLVDEIAKFYTSGLSFTGYTIFTLPSMTGDPLPKYSAQLSQVGVTTSSTWQKAVQITMTARTSAFGVAKIVMLDAISENNWDRITVLPGSGNVATLWAEWSDVTNGWAGRDNGRPATFLQVSKTLNEKLRRQYHML